MNDQQIEQEIQDKGLTAPRVTPADIEANIASEHYFTAYEGAQASQIFTFHHPVGGKSGTFRPLELLTFCVLVLRNGFTVTGESACASPENFDAELGRKIARQNAVNKVWMLEGYLLKERLHQSAIAPVPVPPTPQPALGLEQAARSFVGGTFGQALDHLKRGGKVAREGWNGKGMHLYLWAHPYDQPPAGIATLLEPCVVMLTAQGNRQPGWLASQADMLATDWLSIE